MFYSKIVGTGFYVPERVVLNSELEKSLDTTDEWIRNKIGVDQRFIADEKESTSDLAYKASIVAIDNAKIDKNDIDMILLATNTPDHLSPATAIQIQQKLNLKNVFCFDIRAGGCPGLIYALSIASKFIYDGTCKSILVVTADLNSRWIDWEDRLTAVIMGDGASAVVLQASTIKQGCIQNIDLHTDPEGYYDAYVPAGGSVEPLTSDAILNRRNFFKMNGKKIYEFATREFPNTVSRLMLKSGYKVEDIDLIIPHQSNINIIRDSMSKLCLPFEKAFCNIDKYANTGGSSVGIALSEALESETIKKGQKVVLVAYGVGNSWGSILVEF